MKSFFSRSQVKKVKDEECKYVLKVWNTFQMKKMKDYHDFYLECDVLLLGYFKNI